MISNTAVLSLILIIYCGKSQMNDQYEYPSECIDDCFCSLIQATFFPLVKNALHFRQMIPHSTITNLISGMTMKVLYRW